MWKREKGGKNICYRVNESPSLVCEAFGVACAMWKAPLPFSPSERDTIKKKNQCRPPLQSAGNLVRYCKICLICLPREYIYPWSAECVGYMGFDKACSDCWIPHLAANASWDRLQPTELSDRIANKRRKFKVLQKEWKRSRQRGCSGVLGLDALSHWLSCHSHEEVLCC